MEVRKVGFKELEEACCQLSAQGCPGTLYQSYEWLRTWWNHFGADHCQPCILVAGEGPRIIGLAPLMIEKMRIKGFPVLRTLRFIGTGPSDYLDFLVVQGREAEIMSAFFNHLLKHKREWDFMWLSEVPDNSPARNFLLAGLSDLGLTSIVEQHNVCPYIELNNTYAEYVGSLNFETRKKVKKLRNRLVRTGEVEFVVVDNDPGAIREAMSEFFCLHNERWRREGARGHVRSKELIDFHTEAAVALSNKLHLCVLRLRGQIIASMYCYDWENVRYFYWVGWNPDFAEHSPGFVITGFDIEDAINKGLKGFDFLRGDEAYKFHLAKRSKNNSRYFIFHSKIHLFLFLLLKEFAGNHMSTKSVRQALSNIAHQWRNSSVALS